MGTPELKPCPFCGGEAEVRGSTSSYVACTKCEAEGPFFEVHFFPTSENVHESDKLAIAAWNTRTPEQPQWEQMAEETTFEDGEFVVIRRSKHHGYHKMFAQWSSVYGQFFSNSTPVPVSTEDCFIRIPK